MASNFNVALYVTIAVWEVWLCLLHHVQWHYKYALCSQYHSKLYNWDITIFSTWKFGYWITIVCAGLSSFECGNWCLHNYVNDLFFLKCDLKDVTACASHDISMENVQRTSCLKLSWTWPLTLMWPQMWASISTWPAQRHHLVGWVGCRNTSWWYLFLLLLMPYWGQCTWRYGTADGNGP